MNKKAATSLATVILVVMTILLSGIAIFGILLVQNVGKGEITNPSFIANLYIKESQANHYSFFGVEKSNLNLYIPGLTITDKINIKETSKDNKIEASYRFLLSHSDIYTSKPKTSSEKNIQFQATFTKEISGTPNEQHNKVFEFADGLITRNLYYKFFNEGWAWTWYLDEDNYPNKNGKAIWYGSGEDIYFGNVERQVDILFIKGLIGKDYEQGLKILADRTFENNEGGWFSSSSLIYYYNGKEKEYKHDNPLLENINLLEEDITKLQ